MTPKKPAFLFSGKESKKEEAAEKKVGKAAYAKGEKKEAMMAGKKAPPFGKKK